VLNEISILNLSFMNDYVKILFVGFDMKIYVLKTPIFLFSDVIITELTKRKTSR
jgi:hypothetical protein